jgi:MFS family permease
VTHPALHRNREFVALWLGQAVSNLGISISSFAYPLVVLEATGSPTKAGLVGSILAGTAFFLRLPAGVLVDRWNRRAIMITCDAGRAINAAAFAATLALGHFYFAQVLLVAVVEAALGVLFGPAEAAVLRSVVAPERRRTAVALNQSRAALPRLLGPPIAGLLLAIDRALPFAADAASYGVSLACVTLLPRTIPDDERMERPHPVRSAADGLRWIWAEPFLRALALWSVGVGVVFSSLGLVILITARERGASHAALGALFGITAAGGVAGALLAPALVRRVPPFPLIAAFAWTTVAATFALEAARSPVALGAPFGPVVAGGLLGALGPRTTIAVYGSLALMLAIVASASPSLRRRRR